MLERPYILGEGDAQQDWTRTPKLQNVHPERESLLTSSTLLSRPGPHRNMNETLPRIFPNQEDLRFKEGTFPRRVTTPMTTPHKNTYGSGPEVNDMLKGIQGELDALKESVRINSKTSDSCFYERIDDLHRSRESRDSSASYRGHLVKIAKENGLHRIRYLIDHETGSCARFVFVLVCLACSALLAYQLYDRITLFLRSPSHTITEHRHLESVEFPAVTICNLNKFKLTETVKLGLYSPLYKILHSSRPLNYHSIIQSLDKSNLTYHNFLETVGHQISDTIHSCRFKGQPCEPNDITPTVTENGLCLTFLRKHGGRSIQKAGFTSGLSLVINIEQYEYLLGPKSAVGARISVADSITQRVPSSNTMNIPVGKYSSIALNLVRRKEIAGYSGACRPGSQTVRDQHEYEICIQSCRWLLFVKRCNCVPLVSKLKGSHRPCLLSEYYNCYLSALKKRDFGDSSCGCQKPCQVRDYELSTSQAAISSYGVESSVRNFPSRLRLQSRYRTAMDTYHRVDATVFKHDFEMLRTIPQALSTTKHKEKFNKYLQNYDKKYDKHFSEALKSLNETVSIDYKFFAQPTHMSFIGYRGRVQNTLRDILSLESSLTAQFSVSSTDDDVINILNKIKDIVNIDSSSDSAAFFQEMESGIESFKRKIFRGYGQNYREFKNNKVFYMNSTKVSLDKILNISKELKRQYGKLSTMTPQKSLLVLNDFFTYVRKVMDRDLHLLNSLFDKIFSQYDKDRRLVLNFISSLSSVSRQLVEDLKMWRLNLTAFSNVVTSFPLSLNSVRDEMVKLSKDYVGKRSWKSNLAQKLQSSSISRPLNQAQEELNKIGTMVNELSVKGSELVKVISGLISRLVDFGLFNETKVHDLTSWLTFNPLRQAVDQYMSGTDDKLQLIKVYQQELQEYVQSIKIDEQFYRNNFLHVDVAFRDISETVISQQVSYTLLDLACDIGGAMALCVGASVLTLFDVAYYIQKSFSYYAE